MNTSGWRGYMRSPYKTHGVTDCEPTKKQTKFKITLRSADGKIVNTWTSKSYPRFESSVWQFHDQSTGLPVRITGGIVTVESFEVNAE